MPERAIGVAKPADDTPAQTYTGTEPTGDTSERARVRTETKAGAPAPILAGLVITAEHLDDLERMRVRFGNQVAAFEREYGWAPPHLDAQLKALRAQEHDVTLALKRLWRQHPLAPWAKEIPGCGEKLMARLIGIIGDPAERPNIAKLWQFCGYGDPAFSRPPKGATQAEVLRCGSPKAKKTVWLLVQQFKMRTGEHQPRSPYRDVIEEGRTKYANRDDWTPLHQMRAADRLAAKAFLRDLWVVARAQSRGETHTAYGAGHSANETQRTSARAHSGRENQRKIGAGQSSDEAQAVGARALDKHEAQERIGAGTSIEGEV